MDIKIPEWWIKYKESNPNETDDYDPNKHCCSSYWKDFCDCVSTHLSKARSRSKERNVNGTTRFLKTNKIPYNETNVFNVVTIDYNNKKVFVSLKKDKKGLLKCRFEGNNKWYTYTKDKFIHTFKKDNSTQPQSN